MDWSLFDIVGVDRYRDERVKDRYADMLELYSAHAKPVVVTEFGMRAYEGAASSGALGFGVVDNSRCSCTTSRLWAVGAGAAERLLCPR